MDADQDERGNPSSQLSWGETPNQVTTASSGSYVYELLVESEGLCTLVISDDGLDADRQEQSRTQHRSEREAKDAAEDWNRTHSGPST